MRMAPFCRTGTQGQVPTAIVRGLAAQFLVGWASATIDGVGLLMGGRRVTKGLALTQSRRSCRMFSPVIAFVVAGTILAISGCEDGTEASRPGEAGSNTSGSSTGKAPAP